MISEVVTLLDSSDRETFFIVVLMCLLVGGAKVLFNRTLVTYGQHCYGKVETDISSKEC